MEELSQLGVSSHRASSPPPPHPPSSAAAAVFIQASSSSPNASSITSTNAAAAVAAAVAPPPPASLLGKGFVGWPVSPLPLISAHHHLFPFHLGAAAPAAAPAPASSSSQRRSAAGDAGTSSSDVDGIKAKIIAHPRYSALLSAYINCQKVGAPPGVRERLSAAAPEYAARQRAALACGDRPTPTDPDLDRFMEAYCQMLVKYEEELARPLQEATEFLRNAEAELNSITHGSFHVLSSDENDISSEEEQELENGIREASDQLLPSAAEAETKEPDVELKKYLLKRYSGHLTGLRQELCKKKKKKGKLPKESIQKLLNWWEMHYKWPYPSETEKLALAESTGLDQKQINNWFINQRKRHWKPTEDKHFVLMDGAGGFNVAPSTHAAAIYMADGLYHLNAP